jgi:tetratricopeptide (TPR) repeat protein
MIVSFFSYKGGVGRTQLLANMAAYLCHYRGRKVLLMDWDLEAPGIHYYFGKNNTTLKVRGVINLLQEYVRVVKSKKETTQRDLPFFDPSYITNLRRSTSAKGRIDLIPAGQYNQKYSQMVSNFDWNEFYELLDGKLYIEFLKERLRALDYDYIFLDSRTGISDYSGICNVQFPDANIMLTAPTHQSFEGTLRVANSIISSSYVLGKFRKPVIFPILSRIDLSIEGKSETWTRLFKEKFGFLIKNLDKQYYENHAEIKENQYLKETMLDYKRDLAFGENVLFDDDRRTPEFGTLAEKYANLVRYLEKDPSGQSPSTSMAGRLFNLANAKAELEQYEDAIADYDKSIEINPNFTEAYINRGNARGSLGLWDLALEDFNTALSLSPDDHRIYNNRANIFRRLEQFEAALQDSNKAIEIKPDFADSYFTRGSVKFAMQKHLEAIKDFDAGLRLNPSSAKGYNNRGLAKKALKQYIEAISDFYKALEHNPDNFESIINCGTVKSLMGNYEEAISDYDKAIAIRPKFANAYYNRAICKTKIEEYEAALEDLNKAIELDGKKVNYFRDRGFNHYQTGNFSQALKDYLKACEINPFDASAHYNAACLFGFYQNKADLILHLREALVLDMNFKNQALTEKDFDWIRNDPDFKTLLA